MAAETQSFLMVLILGKHMLTDFKKWALLLALCEFSIIEGKARFGVSPKNKSIEGFQFWKTLAKLALMLKTGVAVGCR